MCTFNGSAHVIEQVTSIVTQLGPSDELIVADDGSTDRTVSLVRDATAGATASVQVIVNDEPKGVVGNFEGAIARATREVVFLADQDDVWHADKVRAIRAAFAADAQLLAVFSNAHLLENGGRGTKTLWDTNGVGWFARRRFRRGLAFEQLLRRNAVTGATLAVRARVASTALPFPTVTMHDYWLALIASALGPVQAIEQPLIDYRVHAAQVVGPESTSMRQQLEVRRSDPATRARELAMFIALHERVHSHLSVGHRARLDAKIGFLARRADLAPTVWGRLLGVMADMTMLRYHRFARGLRSAGRDLVIGH